MSDRLTERHEEDIKRLYELYDDMHTALQGKTGEKGLSAVIDLHQHALFDEKEGLMNWKRDMQAFFYKAMGASFILSTLGALIGTLIMWWLTYRAGK